MKIVIEESDALYRHGMEQLLKKIFASQGNAAIEIEKLTPTNLLNADIIVKRYDAGIKYICQPLIRKRKANSLIIGVYEGDRDDINSGLPLCISNIVFINRRESVVKAKDIIMQGWEECHSRPRSYNHLMCVSCKHRTLTSQQVLVAAHFYRGYSPQKTAEILNINYKTVGAHKRMIMTKFDLETDYDLLNFINILLKNNYASERFKNTLNSRLEHL